jgi:hypothetical protein
MKNATESIIKVWIGTKIGFRFSFFDNLSTACNLGIMDHFLIPLFHSSGVQPTTSHVTSCDLQPHLKIIHIYSIQKKIMWLDVTLIVIITRDL